MNEAAERLRELMAQAVIGPVSEGILLRLDQALDEALAAERELLMQRHEEA